MRSFDRPCRILNILILTRRYIPVSPPTDIHYFLLTHYDCTVNFKASKSSLWFREMYAALATRAGDIVTVLGGSQLQMQRQPQPS